MGFGGSRCGPKVPCPGCDGEPLRTHLDDEKGLVYVLHFRNNARCPYSHEPALETALTRAFLARRKKHEPVEIVVTMSAREGAAIVTCKFSGCGATFDLGKGAGLGRRRQAFEQHKAACARLTPEERGQQRRTIESNRARNGRRAQQLRDHKTPLVAGSVGA